ncbi:bifunctional riboflavin kinase/FAD synthetase [Candidatus Stoquefichus massiliensis]|uniref:bifunctional riboflavin kinase/FAD synthetase n=1 Tax=Candidatus Stoquefichus massiliensis TaxID=1470350 RepID=UPI0004831DA0|nr:bifunctional riboflavin kinase/FAD synthetase [Candidatus Stoquefichus massiliensis]
MDVIYLKGQKVNIEEPICSAIGFFDGIHVGHMALVDEVIKVSQDKGYKQALMTFDHYPLYVLGKISEERYLTSMDDRIRILEAKGLDYLFVIEFTKEVAALSPEDFIQRYLIDCHVKHVVCGFDFRFGCHNLGDVNTLQHCSFLDVSMIEEVIYNGEKISSSRIRQILEDGNISDMNALLGHLYTIRGKVIHGRRIGHSIGFPTANIDYQSYFLPCGGVYVVKTYIQDKCYLGMCNIGYNPTFTVLDKPSLEVNILDFHGDIYGEDIAVEFYCLIRKEQAFASQEDLIQQLTKDQMYVRKYFEEN